MIYICEMVIRIKWKTHRQKCNGKTNIAGKFNYFMIFSKSDSCNGEMNEEKMEVDNGFFYTQIK